MRLKEKFLFLLSRDPESKDYKIGEGWNLENALSLLCRVFPNFKTRIAGKRILDYGCGQGYQAVALALNGAKYVLGLDISEKGLQKGRELARKQSVGHQVEFFNKLDDYFKGRFDIVISQNSMEHFTDPSKALDDMKTALHQNGTMLITFAPPWFAPYGGHTHFFTKIPWVHIIFDEKTIMNVRSRFRSDGASKYEEVKGGLNKMSVDKFEQLISENGLEVQYCKYGCVKSINFLGKIPLVRELFINQISCILVKRR